MNWIASFLSENVAFSDDEIHAKYIMKHQYVRQTFLLSLQLFYFPLFTMFKISLCSCSAEHSIWIYSIAFAKAYTIMLYRKQSSVVFLYVLLFFCLAQFTLFVIKSLKIVIEKFQKYHWIQHKKMQPVVVTSEPIDRT